MDIKSRWIEFNREPIERPFFLTSLRKCRVLDPSDEGLSEENTLALLAPETVNRYLREERIETVSQTYHIGADGGREPEPSSKAIPRLPHADAVCWLKSLDGLRFSMFLRLVIGISIEFR